MIRTTLLALVAVVLAAATPAEQLVLAARAQIGVTTRYDGAYQKLRFPMGDVPVERGVCTDVVVRAYRKLGVDLQALVHRDMLRAWAEYPQLWRMKGPDSNIDHRRVPNLATYFQRHGKPLAITRDPKNYCPGEIVTWRLISGVPHIGIVSDKKTPAGIPLILHNIGAGTQEDDILFVYTLTGHFRYFPS